MGWVYNLPENHGPSSAPKFIGIVSTFTSVSSIAVLLRLHTRLYLVRAFGRDDATILITVVCQPKRFIDPLSCILRYHS